MLTYRDREIIARHLNGFSLEETAEALEITDEEVVKVIADNPPAQYILYHDRCLDGFGAAYAAWRYFGSDDTAYIPVRYQELPPWMLKGVPIYILDFSYPRTVLEDLAEKHYVMVIDHHKSAAEDLEKPIEGVDTVFDMERSGCILAWQAFHDESPPTLLEHIEDRDLWEFDLKHTEAICAALWNKDRDFLVWDEIIKDADVYRRLRYVGKNIINIRDRNIASANKRAFYGDIASVRCIMVNTPLHVSEAAKALLKRHPEVEVAVCFSMTDAGEWKWDFRSRKEGFDVSKLAKIFGGGGHQAAAGLRTSNLIFEWKGTP